MVTTPPDPRRASRLPATDLLIVALAFALVCSAAALTQPMSKAFADSEVYQFVSEEFFQSHLPINSQVNPAWSGGGQALVAANRIATPWLAAQMRLPVKRVFPALDARAVDSVGRDGAASFLVVNLAASAVAALLLLLFLRQFIDSAAIRGLLVVCWMTMWHSPVRWTFFYPMNVDALFMVMLIAGLLVMERLRERRPIVVALALAPIVFAGTLVRESIVLVPASFAAAQMLAFARDRRVERVMASAVPFFALGAAWLLVRTIVTPVPGHAQWAEVGAILRDKPLWTWVLGWYFTFGAGVVALTVAGHEEARRFLRTRPELVTHLVLCGFLGYFAGTGSDTERLLAWAAPVVLVLAGKVIAARRETLGRARAVLMVLVTAQILSSRILWPIPLGSSSETPFSQIEPNWEGLIAVADKFLVMYSGYPNLWSFFGSREIHAAVLAFDIALTVVVIVAMNGHTLASLLSRNRSYTHGGSSRK